MKGLFCTLTPEQQKAALEYRGPEGHGDPEFRYFTEEEIAQLREQMRRGDELAKEAVRKAGITLHPRIAALKEKK